MAKTRYFIAQCPKCRVAVIVLKTAELLDNFKDLVEYAIKKTPFCEHAPRSYLQNTGVLKEGINKLVDEPLETFLNRVSASNKASGINIEALKNYKQSARVTCKECKNIFILFLYPEIKEGIEGLLCPMNSKHKVAWSLKRRGSTKG